MQRKVKRCNKPLLHKREAAALLLLSSAAACALMRGRKVPCLALAASSRSESPKVSPQHKVDCNLHPCEQRRHLCLSSTPGYSDTTCGISNVRHGYPDSRQPPAHPRPINRTPIDSRSSFTHTIQSAPVISIFAPIVTAVTMPLFHTAQTSDSTLIRIHNPSRPIVVEATV